MSGGADILGVPELFVEAKRVERLNFHDALRQAERNADKTKSSDTPIVINRKNRQPTGDSLCLVRLDEFLKFYKAYLVQQGQIDTESDRGASVQRVQAGATIK